MLTDLPGLLDTIFDLAVTVIIMAVMAVGLLGVFALGQAQVLWAQIALSIALLLGPVFIPWIIVPPLSFLFWGGSERCWCTRCTDDTAFLSGQRGDDVGTQFGEAGLELLGRDVVTVLSGLPDGVSGGVGLCRREVGVGQRAGDGVRVEHRFRLPRRGEGL